MPRGSVRVFQFVVMLLRRFICVGVWVAAAASGVVVTQGHPVLEWNGLFLGAIRAGNSAPTLASRNLAILHTAIYDAVNSIERSHLPYRFLVEAAPGASVEAAAVGAAFSASVLLYPEHRAAFDDAYAEFLRAAGESGSVTDALQLGRRVGQMAVDGRIADGASTAVPYIPSDAPGEWRRTPPFFRPPLDPNWGWVDPFCLDDADRFLPPGPPSLDSPAYAADVNMVKALGGSTSALRTEDESSIARFWSDFSYTETPPGHWMDVVANVVMSRGYDVPQAARLCALVALAQADAAIVVWRAKYAYNFWRPVTAIQRADEDGNPATDKDLSWQSFLVTPPFPEYVSGHSTFSMASAMVLGRFCGTDTITFTVRSDTLAGVVRTYDSFTECAHEIGMSRIWGGIHFLSANRDGKACGARIAEFVFGNYLLATADLPTVTLSREPDGSGRLRAHARPGRACVVEMSPDLVHWPSISTNQAVLGGAIVQLPEAASHGVGFFRAVEEPAAD